MVDLQVVGHVALRERAASSTRAIWARILDLNEVADLHLERGDVDAAAVDLEMAVVDELARGEHGRNEFGAIDDRVKPALEEADQVGARVALIASPRRKLLVELALGDVA